MRKTINKVGGNESSDNEDDEPLVKSSTESDKDGEYEVERILKVRKVKGKKEYLVRWKGYSEDDDTWEPEAQLECPDKIAEFEQSEEKSSKKSTSAKNGKNSKRAAKNKTGGAQKKKKTKSSAADSDTDDEKEYEVEKILEIHHKKNGKREFLVHWKGFSKEDDSWEPEENLNCELLIEKFLKKVSEAKSSTPRETRVNRKATDRYIINAPDSGRKLSGRNRGPRRTYFDDE